MKKLLKILSSAVLWYLGISILLTIVRLIQLPTSASCIEYSVKDSISSNYLHHRSWSVYSIRQEVCTSVMAEKAENDRTLRRRNEMSHPRYNQAYYEDYWQLVYRNLSELDSRVLQRLQDSLIMRVVDEGLDHYETAELLVSFIQDIPYTLIKTDDCTENDVNPCLGNQKFGLLAPSEFLYELNGDCDTRAVLLYKLLNNMGYPTIIIISREYGHAMIAVDLPIAGDHIEYRGIPYYFWETTAKGWKAGMLPPSYTEISYWKIALTPPLL